MVMFGVMVLGFLRKKAGHVVAQRQYPQLAEDLGLTFIPSRYRSGVGRIVGTLTGFRVSVDPDEQKNVRVLFETPPGVELWMHVHHRRPPPGMKLFRPASPGLASLFRTAHGTQQAIARLDAAAGGETLSNMARRLRRFRQLKSLSVTEGGVTAVLDYGSPPFIPADVVRSLLDDLVGIARVFQEGSTRTVPPGNSVPSGNKRGEQQLN